MENINPQESLKQPNENPPKINFKMILQILAVLLFGSFIYTRFINSETKVNIQDRLQQKHTISSDLQEKVLPSQGIIIRAKWGNFGSQMIEKGIIDKDKFEELYAERGGLREEDKKILYAADNGEIVINEKNSGFMLNMLWALGLANKNTILEQGPMHDSGREGAGNFASTGGWTLAKGNAMEHYSKYTLLALTQEQQKLVEGISKNIYRPCCDNPTFFPDCNHGMAMLGLLELMASQGMNEQEMYTAALQVNSYWFPDTYTTLAKYFEKKGVDWKNVDPKEVLGINYSSASGYQKILEQINPEEIEGGGGCGV